MKCTRAQELFSSYLEDTIEAPLRVAFEQHLAECSECNAAYERFNATVMMLDEVNEVETPPDLHTLIMARVEEARRAKPSRVKWWSIDWERVFTVRVPARAVAMGFAVVLLLAVLIQLTPINGMMAGLFPGKVTKQMPTVPGDSEAPMEWSPLGGDWLERASYQPAGSGLAIAVVAKSGEGGGYALKLKTASTQPIEYTAYLYPNNSAAIKSGSIDRSDNAYVEIPAEGSEPIAARVVWNYRGTQYSAFTFLPVNFDIMSGNKTTNVSFRSESVFGRLKDVSSRFGVVVLASGDLTKQINRLNSKVSKPDTALDASVTEAGLSWKMIAPSVFVVEPAE